MSRNILVRKIMKKVTVIPMSSSQGLTIRADCCGGSPAINHDSGWFIPWQGMVYTHRNADQNGMVYGFESHMITFLKAHLPELPELPPQLPEKSWIWAGERFVPAVLASTSSVCPRFLRLRNIATDEMSNLCFFFTSQDDYEMRWKIRPWWLMSAIFQWLCSKPAMPLQFLSQN